MCSTARFRYAAVPVGVQEQVTAAVELLATMRKQLEEASQGAFGQRTTSAIFGNIF